MLQAIQKLVNGYNSAGNHTAMHDGDLESRFYYFGNLVCVATHTNETFELHHCGYAKSSSTTRALNDYERWFKSKGYTLLYRGE